MKNDDILFQMSCYNEIIKLAGTILDLKVGVHGTSGCSSKQDIRNKSNQAADAYFKAKLAQKPAVVSFINTICPVLYDICL
jgi:hypothetical protein